MNYFILSLVGFVLIIAGLLTTKIKDPQDKSLRNNIFWLINMGLLIPLLFISDKNTRNYLLLWALCVQIGAIIKEILIAFSKRRKAAKKR